MQKYEIEAEVTVKINMLTDSMFPEEAMDKIMKLMPPHTDINIVKLDVKEITDTSEYNFMDFFGNTFKRP